MVTAMGFLIAATVALPNPTLTPGRIDSHLTKDHLCSHTFRTRDERHVTPAMKRRVCRAYDIYSGCPGHGYEIDHLISIELGGAETEDNLWPQPIDSVDVVGFRTKDGVETRAHTAVCAGRLTLEEAQRGVRGNWYEWAKKNNLLKGRRK